jgi:hypothetical protein
MTTTTTTPAAALVEARKNSADLQVAQSIATALRMGQQFLIPEQDAPKIKLMQPDHKAAALDLLERWVQLDKDARCLVARISIEIGDEVLA